MAKKASAKVAKKADLKKKKVKKEKTGRSKKGRAWYMPSYLAASEAMDNFVVGDNEILAKTLQAFAAADDNVVYEGALVETLEKEGVKPEGKKTVKKLVKGVLRNMSRAGVIGKERDRRREEKENRKKNKGKKEETKKKDDGDDDDEEEVVEEAPKKSVLKKKK